MKQADLQLFGFVMLRYVFITVLFLWAIQSNAADTPVNLSDEHGAVDGLNEPLELIATRTGVNNVRIVDPSGSGLVIDVASVALSGNMDLSTTSSVFFRGRSATTMTFDGQGFFLQMPRASNPFLQIAARKNVILKNIVLKDFSPEHIRLFTSASIVFGDNVLIQLADSTQRLNSSWVFDGVGSVVDGRGGSLQLNVADAILVNENKDVTFKNIRLMGVSSQDTGHKIRCRGVLSRVILDDATVILDSFFNVVQGNMIARNDVTIKGLGSTLAWTSTGTLRLDSFACLKFDYGTTFSYDAASKTRTNIVMNDVSSLLYLNNATVHATRAGLTLSTGSLYCENIVTFVSEATVEAEALVLDKSLQAFVPNGSTVEIKGKVVYQ